MLGNVNLFHWHDGGLDVSIWMLLVFMLVYMAVYAIIDMFLSHRRKMCMIYQQYEAAKEKSG